MGPGGLATWSGCCSIFMGGKQLTIILQRAYAEGERLLGELFTLARRCIATGTIRRMTLCSTGEPSVGGLCYWRTL